MRVRAVSWFGNYRGRSGFEVLKGLAASDPDERVRERAISTLGNSREPDVARRADPVGAQGRGRAHPFPAISALNRRSGAKVLDTLRDAVENDPDISVRRRAVSALQNMPDGEGIPLLIQLAKNTKDNEVRKQAMNSLGNSHDMRAIAFFESVLK